MSNLILSPKYKAFLRCNAPVEFLEGTTAAGKTTVGIFKFILKCAQSPKKIHILSGLDLGTIEKNIINKDLGILDDFGMLTEYNARGRGQYSLPHIVLHTSSGNKIIYVLGYDNKTRWKKALGGQYGCLYIDEINIADMEYVREASMRCDYLLATLNPDDPNLPIYKEYINCSRPLPEWEHETPAEIMNMLSEEPKPGWVHWFFSFAHNYGLTAEKIEQIKRNVPKGTKLYKNKIEGLRGRATGLVFSIFERSRHVRSKEWAKQYIPDNLLPRNPNTGIPVKPNAFDNRFIAIGADMGQMAQNRIVTEQPNIPHDSYLATYITALDLALQGIISPSTLGIDVKKLDNAEAQREKEKTTLYTRSSLINLIGEVFPQLVQAAVAGYQLWHETDINIPESSVNFGEYANPSFEAVVETVTKAKQGGIMSIEASVDEVYGDTKDDDWKSTEVQRIKAQTGVESMSEPVLFTD